MSDVTEEMVREALSSVQDPDLRRDIVALGFVKEVRICDGNVAARIELTTPACPVKEQLKQEAHDAISALAGVRGVTIEMTAVVRGRDTSLQELVPGVRHVIAVASGKGGVGKSTVAANLAIALAKTGAKVGLLDADIYGPSMPLMMGVRRKPLSARTDTGLKMVPIPAHGVLVMSLGFLLDDDKAVIWRGPMVGATVRQLLADVTWGEQDYLVVDLPPGTGDASLTLAQQAPLSGVVVVTTPQQVAQEIARKSVLMFRTISENGGREIPILGLVENMSGGVFGSGGGERAAAAMQIPFLGSIPLDADVAASGDAGEPITVSHPDSAAAKAFRSLAGGLAARLSVLQYESARETAGAVR